jgi:hypothetical protein
MILRNVHLHGEGHGHGPGEAPRGEDGQEIRLKPAPPRAVLPDRRLSFTPEVWRKLYLFTTQCPVEISGLGMVEPNGEDFICTELFLVTQDVTDIQTRLDQEEVSLLVSRLVDEGRDPSGLRLWWHSHAREEVFWSGEDEETIEHFANDWMISLETNHRMRTLSRLDHYAVRSTTWVWVDRPPEPVVATDEEILAVRQEIARLIRRGPFAAPRGRG